MATTLIHLIQSWLIDTESFQLLLTCHCLNKEVQSFYKARLRASAVGKSVSHIASYQESIYCIRSAILLNEQGEQTFQQCLALKQSGLSEADYRSAALQLLTTALQTSKDPKHWSEVAAGVGLGLGGTLMTETDRSALFAFILGSFKTRTQVQMGAMIAGVCCALGGPKIRRAQLQMVVRDILGSHKTGMPSQLGWMIRDIRSGIGPACSKPVMRAVLLDEILAWAGVCSTAHMGFVMKCCCDAFLPGKDMSREDRDCVFERIKDSEKLGNPKMTRAMMFGLCGGLGERAMSMPNLDAILTLILHINKTWSSREMAEAIGYLGIFLGRTALSPERRDLIADRILGSHATSTPTQMGMMMLSLCRVIGVADPALPITLSEENLASLTGKILASHATSSPAQMGAMIFDVYRALGAANITPAHRLAFTSIVRKSGHLRKTIAALQLFDGGDEVVAVLKSKEHK